MLPTLIDDAIEKRRELRIIYRKQGGANRDVHVIRPCYMRFMKQKWFVLAHDVTRDGALRTFILKRIDDALRTGKTFTWPPGFDPEKILRGNIGAYTGTEDHEVRIALTGPAAVDAHEEHGIPPRQKRRYPTAGWRSLFG